MVGYDASDTVEGKASREAALKFGAPVIWGHQEVSPGRTLSAAIECGVPWLYVESPNGGRVSAVDLPFYINGILNLLSHLKIIQKVIAAATPKLCLIGSGDVDKTQSVSTSGFFVLKVKLLEQVEIGYLIGIVRNLFGEMIEEIRAEQTGYVTMLRANPIVNPGDPVCVITESEDF
jgi:predicted deacylase